MPMPPYRPISFPTVQYTGSGHVVICATVEAVNALPAGKYSAAATQTPMMVATPAPASVSSTVMARFRQAVQPSTGRVAALDVAAAAQMSQTTGTVLTDAQVQALMASIRLTV